MKPLRILVIEDDALIGMLLTEMLSDMGHEVCGVEATEAGAVAAASAHLPDLLIVDAQLREGTGCAAIGRIIADRPVPHVMMSGVDIPTLRPGAATLRKPFVEGGLARAIQCALDAGGVG
jgi:CheY-like chemotaxis protein